MNRKPGKQVPAPALPADDLRHGLTPAQIRYWAPELVATAEHDPKTHVAAWWRRENFIQRTLALMLSHASMPGDVDRYLAHAEDAAIALETRDHGL